MSCAKILKCVICSVSLMCSCVLRSNTVDVNDAYVGDHGKLILIQVVIERKNIEINAWGGYSLWPIYIHRIKPTLYKSCIKELHYKYSIFTLVSQHPCNFVMNFILYWVKSTFVAYKSTLYKMFLNK